MSEALEHVRGIPDGWIIFSDAAHPDNYVQLPDFGLDPVTTTIEAASRSWPGVTSPPLSEAQLAGLSALGFSTTPEPNYRCVAWTRNPAVIARLCDDAMLALGSDEQYDLAINTAQD